MGAAPRCVDCALSSTCAFSAVRAYVEPAIEGCLGWPVNVIVPDAGTCLLRGARA